MRLHQTVIFFFNFRKDILYRMGLFYAQQDYLYLILWVPVKKKKGMTNIH